MLNVKKCMCWYSSIIRQDGISFVTIRKVWLSPYRFSRSLKFFNVFFVKLFYTKFHLHGSGNIEKKGTNSPIPVAVRSKAYACSHSIAGIADSNPAERMDVCVLNLLCVV